MESTEWVRTLKRFIMMYREVYYQERMEEELRKESNRMKLEELPNDLPTTTEAEADVKKCNESKSQAWGCMGISLAFIALAGMLLNGWLIVIGGFSIFIALIIVATASDEQKKAERTLNWKKEERKKKIKEIEKQNEIIKKTYPIEKKVLRGEADKFDNAVRQSRKMLSEECDRVNLPQQFRNFACICSLYQLLYTKNCQSIREAYRLLDGEIKRGTLIQNELRAITFPELVKEKQPVWYNEVIKREEIVQDAIRVNRCRCRRKVTDQELYKLTGIEQEVATQKVIYEECSTQDESPAKYAVGLSSSYCEYILAKSQKEFETVYVLKDYDFSLDR